jgi:hypothetical protein
MVLGVVEGQSDRLFLDMDNIRPIMDIIINTVIMAAVETSLS